VELKSKPGSSIRSNGDWNPRNQPNLKIQCNLQFLHGTGTVRLLPKCNALQCSWRHIDRMRRFKLYFQNGAVVKTLEKYATECCRIFWFDSPSML